MEDEHEHRYMSMSIHIDWEYCIIYLILIEPQGRKHIHSWSVLLLFLRQKAES